MDMIKTKLYLDFDGVIVDTVAAIVSCYNEDYRYYKKFREINPSEIDTYGFTELELASKHYVDHLFNRPRLFERLQFMDNAEEALNILKDKYEIGIVSLGYNPNLVAKQIWVKEHMPYVKPENIHLVNMKKHHDKSHLDLSDGIFLDDSSQILQNTNAKRKYLFGDIYSWNKDWSGDRLHNWYEVLAELALPD